MNIEKIKKDWEQHCKEYGFTGYSKKQNYDGICPSLNTEDLMIKQHELLNIQIRTDGCCVLCNFYTKKQYNQEKYSHTKEQYKLFTTFYEKLMEGIIDE